MTKKRLIIIVSVIVTVLAVAILFAILNSGKSPKSPATPTPSQTPVEEVHPGGEEAHQEEGENNPILSALPHETLYWRLDFDGSTDNKYLFLALVNYNPSQDDPNQKIAEQRPHIEAFVRNTGQPEGTYVIQYEARIVQRD